MSFKDVEEIQAYIPLARLGISLAADVMDVFRDDIDPADEAAVMEAIVKKGEEFERVMARVASSRDRLRSIIARKKAEQAAAEQPDAPPDDDPGA